MYGRAKKIFAGLLAAVLLLGGLLPAFRTAAECVSGKGYEQKLQAVLNWLENGSEPEFGSVNGEWKVFALARSGRIKKSYAEAYYARIEELVERNGNAILNPSKSTDNSRLIIALTSIGRDARQVSGFNLLEPLSDFNYIKKQGINGVIFALLAIDSHRSYGMEAVKNECVNFILGREIEGGGWALSGKNPDPDVTAMAITALCRYASAEQAVKRGVEVLSRIQNENGGYASFGTENCESSCQVLVALSSVGIDAANDERFTKNGTSVLDALLSFYVDGGFSHIAGGMVNGMASEQAAYALAAYERYVSGNNTLYNMNDVSFANAPKPTEKPTARPTYTPTANPTEMPTANPTDMPTAKPADTPTANPTDMPTADPTDILTAGPTGNPTASPVDTEEISAVPRSTSAPSAEQPKSSAAGIAAAVVGIAVISAALIVCLKFRKK